MKSQQAGAVRRRQQIADHVVGRQSATVAELAQLCRVSEMTIYRDLEELERQGVVRKFRGGVTAQPSAVFESNVTYRLAAMRAEKESIARRAATLVEPGMSVMFDDATTTLALARLVADVSPLTVATNYLEIIKLLSGSPGVDLIALGGSYDPTHDSFNGVQCVAAVEAMRVDAVFMSVSAVSEGHAFHQEQHVVAVKQAMLRVARRRVLLVDHSKLGRYALQRLAPLSQFDTVIVDRGLSDDARRDLDDRGVPYQLA
ncbi:MAG: DeoR/GlpR family DNA-binding transcription regulator [Actinomycetota bacterium]|nr:DeoR/GlpR family DNA-binding transcription regulator [Actinomycetota bacterium]